MKKEKNYLSEGNLNEAQSYTRLQITFNATSPTVVIAWGGHIASACDFGSFFFTQKTAYEMVMSDWSSDVCSSDLVSRVEMRNQSAERAHHHRLALWRCFCQ